MKRAQYLVLWWSAWGFSKLVLLIRLRWCLARQYAGWNGKFLVEGAGGFVGSVNTAE
jgi:hypothetical protein